MPPTPPSDGQVHALSWILAIFGVALTTQYVVRDAMGGAPNFAPLLLGFLLMLITVPSARVKKVTFGPGFRMNLDFYDRQQR